MKSYVHGYSDLETSRLFDQARTLVELLHEGTHYPSGSRVLEAGSGVGAQSVTLARRSPEACITSVDISPQSLKRAAKLLERENIPNVKLMEADLLRLPFDDGSFDHVFVCFVLEHLKEPERALLELKRVLATDGTVTVIEGDHGSAFFYPESEYAHKAVECLVRAQASGGGDAHIGRRLYPLLKDAGFHDIGVEPRMVYADESRPEMVDGFTRKTFTSMVEGAMRQVIALELSDESTFKRGVGDLYRTAEPGGVFCYTFFKGSAVKRAQ